MRTLAGRGLIGLGIIGLGGASRQMMPSILAHPRFRLVAAADPSEAARERFARDYAVPVCHGAQELCERADVDAVYVASPHHWHLQNVRAAAAAGKHVIVEKPMALSLQECTEMIEATERSGVVLVVGHTHSFDPPIVKMGEIIRSGSVGRLAMIQSFAYSNFLYRPRRPEELDTAAGGGVVFNQAPHQVDVVRYLGGGRVASVRSVTTRLDPDRPTEGGYMALLQFECGAAASLTFSGYDYFDSDELHGWLGELGEQRPGPAHGSARAALRRARAKAGEAALKAAASGRSPLLPPAAGWSHPHCGVTIASCSGGDLRASPDGVLLYGPAGCEEIALPRGRSYPDKGAVLDELAQALQNGTRPLHDGRWGRATMEVCLALLDSSRERREVLLRWQVSIDGVPAPPTA